MIAPEWRGFGDSDNPGPGTGTTPDQLAEDLNAFLDTLGLARVGLVAHVVVAVDGVEGLEQLERCHPAAVLCDVAMPGMDGLEFATRMRADSQFRGVPLIAVTGVSGQPVLMATWIAAFDGHIAKPVTGAWRSTKRFRGAAVKRP